MISSQLLGTIQLGIKSLLLHKLRSGLTMLGIIFGVCSVIAMLAIGEGASHEAQERIKRLGSTNIIINSFKPPKKTMIRAPADPPSFNAASPIKTPRGCRPPSPTCKR